MSATTVDWPLDGWATPERVEWGIESRLLVTRSVLSGAAQTIDTPFKRWRATLAFSAGRPDEQARREALFTAIRAQSARVRLWHHGRPRPVGTLSGAVTMGAAAAQFATTATIACTTGQTVRRGDMLKLGASLVMATADATSSGGALALTFGPPLRVAVAPGAAVVHVRPTADFVLADDLTPIATARGHGPGFTVAFDEVYT